MRKLVAFLGVACIAGSASAQVAPSPVDLALDCKFFDDGTGTDSWWKINNPNGASDWFNVDFDDTCASSTVLGICTDVWDTIGGGEQMKMGIYPESGAFANTPDLGAPLHEIAATVGASDGFGDVVSYALPCFHLGTTDIHIAMQGRSTDSATWLGADVTGPAFNRSYITSSAYNTGASPVNINWSLGLLVRPADAGKNTLLVNGQLSSSVNVGGLMCLTFWGTQTGQKFILYFCFGGVPFLQLLPVGFTSTGIAFFPGPKPETWNVCVPTACGFVGAPLTFCTIYQDFCDLKVNGKPKLKVSATTTINVLDPNEACIGCYGQVDDGELTGFVWKVTNPSGPSDWFTVNLGTAQTNTAAGGGNVCVTSVEVEITEFCAANGELAWVGHHPPNLTQDPTGATPDTSQGSHVTNVFLPANTTSDNAYPGQVYTIPNLPVTAGGLPYIASVRWVGGDTCIWIASDTDGTATVSGCGTPTPNNNAGISQNDFATNAATVSVVNWAIKVNWVEK